MKKSIQFFVLICSLLCAAESVAGLRGGAAKISLVPNSVIDVPMTGYARGYEARSQGLHDSLFARIVVLEDAETVVAIASVDLIGFNVDRDPGEGRLEPAAIHWGRSLVYCFNAHAWGAPRSRFGQTLCGGSQLAE